MMMTTTTKTHSVRKPIPHLLHLPPPPPSSPTTTNNTRRKPGAHVAFLPSREQSDRVRFLVHARTDPNGPRVGQGRTLRRTLGRRGALERARPHGRRDGPTTLSRSLVLHHEQQGQDGAHTRRQDAHSAQDVPDRDPVEQRRARAEHALRASLLPSSPPLDNPETTSFFHPFCSQMKVLLGGGQEAMSVTTTSLRQGKFEARFWHRIFEEEVGRVKGHFGPLNTYVKNTLFSQIGFLLTGLDQDRRASGGHRICVRRRGRFRSRAPL